MKDEWNKFVKDNSDKTNEWWIEHYRAMLKVRAGLTAREWDHYERIDPKMSIMEIDK